MTAKTAFPPTFSPHALVRRVPGWGWQLVIALGIYAVVSHFILRAYENPDIRFRIDLAPYFAEPSAVQIHVIAALSAFFIGLVLLLAPKGFGLHRTLGWSWVLAMAVTATSSFFITGIMGDVYSPIHAISAWTLLGLPFGVAAARRRDIKKHRQQMTGMFLGAMVIAGLFTFLPGRLMWQIFFTA
ncbi:MAG: DUF2306 domain-containing protein [Hyphomonadaceae bacterium]|nr:DUF2306 domain-containing protein [Hyphomonadaceae bacterium]